MPLMPLKTGSRAAAILALLAMGCPAEDAAWRKMIEDEWLREAATGSGSRVTPENDAIGACDGIKDGKWGFHTELSRDPWWQVDFGMPREINRVILWNRCDGAAPRSAHLKLLASEDGNSWRTIFSNDGRVFMGFTDGKPLDVRLEPVTARYLRVHAPGETYLHLDEVEVFGNAAPKTNLALGRPATQSSISAWSRAHMMPATAADREKLLVRNHARRAKAFANPLLDFDDILFTKRVPGSFNHMSDQYYGWWSRPGGGIYILRNFKGPQPQEVCLTGAFTEPGSFLRPMLSWDAKKVLFAWCRHYPELAAQPDKMDKNKVPADAFYHLFEMNIDGSGLRQVTHGKYDDFDGRYLPDGRIVFMSTRRGTAVQAGRASGARTLAKADLPDSYVRCGGDQSRPVAVYTLHTMNADGSDITAISPFEMFEWEPSIARDGTILYSRWDYIDRDNMPYMSLWSTHPDGSNTRLVFGNYTRNPHCVFEPRSIPGSRKIIFTASGHHAQTMGSLVLLDPSVGSEGDPPMTRLTPEVKFPEIEGWPEEYYANPWPLSEQTHLVSWGREAGISQGRKRPANGMGIYLFDAATGRELIWRDPEISCMYPIPVKPQPVPPVVPDRADWAGPQEGRFIVSDVYQGLGSVKRGDIKSLRIVAVPPKTHPVMNHPNLGVTKDDPGKCVLGTVPVEADGSAHFVAPSGVILFFQVLDADGRAVQTMRSAVHVQPGEVRSCVGCHESRDTTPSFNAPAIAARRAPSKITPGPAGSWPFRYDQLVQPVLDRSCTSCHGAGTDLTLAGPGSYEILTRYGKNSVTQRVMADYHRGQSQVGSGLARDSALVGWLTRPGTPCAAKLDADGWSRINLWLDLYGQRLGSYDPQQEQELIQLRNEWADMLEPPAGASR
jgi:hypothetical protein